MISVGIVGGTGYTGVELLRLLSGHPQTALRAITSRAEAGRRVDDLFPSLRGHVDLCFSDPDDAGLEACDVVFFATPHNVAMRSVPGLLEANVRVIDLSADFRIRDLATWEHWYSEKHACPELLESAVYGLPERHREAIRQAVLVACPGCYPTVVQLGFMPLLVNRLVDTDSLIANAASGVSGAGRQASVANLLSEAGDSFRAYAVTGHRHLPEIRQGLADSAGTDVGLVFVPHLAPMIRGIHATLYARLNERGRDCDLQAVYAASFAGEPFVDVLPAGIYPDTRSVRGANTCRMTVTVPQGGDTVVVTAVEDNLVKGAAGQALQCMNLMFDLDETSGLSSPGMLP